MRPANRLRARGIVAIGLLLLGAPACSESPTDLNPRGDLEPGRIESWQTDTPASQGIDPMVLRDLESRVAAGDLGEISSVLIVRNGVLIYERYWDTWDASQLHPVYSVTKSVTSLAMGVAADDGLLPALDTPVLSLFPEYDDLGDAIRKEAITLEHVLQMRTGLLWDELSTNYRETGNPTTALAQSPDWIEYVLDLPLDTDPGARFTYNSGVSMIMGAVLAARTGMTAEAFAARELFDPLGIDEWFWETGARGLTNSGWGLRLRPRDMMKVGEMVLAGGSWDGQEIVSGSWLDASGAASTMFVDGTGYGYQWWLGEDDGVSRPMAAWGYGGQFIVSIPSLDLVVVSTAENFVSGGFTPYSLADLLYEAAGVTVP